MANVTRLVIATAAAALVTACAAPRETVRTEYVVTPTYCSVTFPERPALDTSFNGNVKNDYNVFVTNLQRFVTYSDELEMALKCCTNSHDCITKSRR